MDLQSPPLKNQILPSRWMRSSRGRDFPSPEDDKSTIQITMSTVIDMDDHSLSHSVCPSLRRPVRAVQGLLHNRSSNSPSAYPVHIPCSPPCFVDPTFSPNRRPEWTSFSEKALPNIPVPAPLRLSAPRRGPAPDVPRSPTISTAFTEVDLPHTQTVEYREAAQAAWKEIQMNDPAWQ
ncbi:uncharacterized protein BXZ73DRAFT_106557 [Epithele typhae]|uniref:uncharacterized protein n=1 Tax=Epithele typhae TaxID=378194 RepID=UPI002007EC5C|nr:uncharacterized protein BXZ73DRAFT_106557 [Epithele typhae]KAH9914662.1 hypothetical protein BXZ73DRAFT_106557 [Epithele typhae]